MIRSIRDEALRLLHKRGTILDTAREISGILRDSEVEGAIIGGVAVVLHGYVRTTADVDVFVPGRLESLAESLQAPAIASNRRSESSQNLRSQFAC